MELWRRRNWLFAWTVIAAVALGLAPANAQEDDEEDENPYRPGLMMSVTDSEGHSVKRISHGPYLVGDPRSLDERIGSGPYRLTWNGRLWVQQPGEHRLAVFLRGRVVVRLGDQIVLEAASADEAWHVSRPLPLEFDHYPLVVEYATEPLASASAARLGLYWSSPAFSLEPIPARFMLHSRAETKEVVEAGRAFEIGRDVWETARCAGCHIPTFATTTGATGEEKSTAAPSLASVRGNLLRPWIVSWLLARPDANAKATTRHMPYFDLSPQQAADLADYLLEKSSPLRRPRQELPAAPVEKGASKSAAPAKPDADAGLRLLRTVGCLACHTHDGLGVQDAWSGGDLTRLAIKRPADFVERWLADPASVNSHHRMPAIDLNKNEARDLAAALAIERPTKAQSVELAQGAEPPAGDATRGQKLFLELRCGACHTGPEPAPAAVVGRRLLALKRLDDGESCVGRMGERQKSEPRRDAPRYAFTASERTSLATYLTARWGESSAAGVANPEARKLALKRESLRQRRCTACHARDEVGGIGPVAQAVVRRDASLAPLLPALSPPSLTGVGDKLLDAALEAAIRRAPGTRRPWLAVRMPRFALEDDELHALRDVLVDSDRVPAGAPAELRPPQIVTRSALPLDDLSLRNTGGRLVTPDGFGCTSCHAVGAVQPPPAPLNARGPDLAQLGQRIRPEWFERWVRNPARIVPRMEMPSVQLPVRGVLEDRLDTQLAAVWHVLNLPGFQPPEPNPVQTVRLTGLATSNERAELITDIVQADGRTLIKPLLLGLPNRHNVLIDLESPRLARWSIGDVARQRTKGKTWFWEAAGFDLLTPRSATATKPSTGGDVTRDDIARGDSEIVWQREDERRGPQAIGQFPVDLEGWRHVEGGVELRYRMEFGEGDEGDKRLASLQVTQTFTPLDRDALAPLNGFRRTIRLRNTARDELQQRRFRLVTHPISRAVDRAKPSFTEDRRSATWDGGATRVTIETNDVRWDEDGSVLFPSSDADDGSSALSLTYRASLKSDTFAPPPVVKGPPLQPEEITSVPGFRAVRLPLDPRPMPTALAWRPDGSLIVGSLKGRVLIARDTDGDSYEDTWSVFSDELAAPYGVAAAGDAIDVTTKYAVLRLFDDDHDGRADRSEVVASGWGHTADYHDWTVGLPSDGAGGYYVGLACQQDKRGREAAALRGVVLRLVAPTGSLAPGERFRLETISGGHRFPMGLARDGDGELFVTDNQGNYNPFNELNHVRAGRRYGFINSIEQAPDFKPPTESPAIEIPHPWTRSVNGITFLNGPPRSGTSDARPFGPFTGHLVGCEYDTRRLVRMSLQKVGSTYQGAVYPLTRDDPAGDSPFLGPISCAISPRGELYVGGIRDSGWGGGNNHGELVRMTFDAERLPAGIAEVRTTNDGFEIDWTKPLAVDRLSQIANYSLSSYRRISTPAYGGNDVDRREESIVKMEVAPDGRRTRLQLPEVRRGFVYELRVRNLAPANTTFHPSEAHITVR